MPIVENHLKKGKKIFHVSERKEVQNRRLDDLRDAVKFSANSRALRTLMSDEGEKRSFSVYLAL